MQSISMGKRNCIIFQKRNNTKFCQFCQVLSRFCHHLTKLNQAHRSRYNAIYWLKKIKNIFIIRCFVRKIDILLVCGYMDIFFHGVTSYASVYISENLTKHIFSLFFLY